jgi:hypothetical protein
MSGFSWQVPTFRSLHGNPAKHTSGFGSQSCQTAVCLAPQSLHGGRAKAVNTCRTALAPTLLAKFPHVRSSFLRYENPGTEPCPMGPLPSDWPSGASGPLCTMTHRDLRAHRSLAARMRLRLRAGRLNRNRRSSLRPIPIHFQACRGDRRRLLRRSLLGRLTCYPTDYRNHRSLLCRRSGPLPKGRSSSSRRVRRIPTPPQTTAGSSARSTVTANRRRSWHPPS